MINLRPGEPIYLQIAAELREQILSGQLRPGEPVPSERTLVQELGVARETIRRAHAVLRAEGLLVRPRGHSLHVRELPEMRDLIPPPGATVTARSTTRDERHDLQVPEGVPVLVVSYPGEPDRLYPADRWRLPWPG